MKTPALASGYMQGDVCRFECFQTHWIKGDSEYKCAQVVDYNVSGQSGMIGVLHHTIQYPNSWRFEWNKGSQPWCRSREMDNMLTWLIGILR